MEKVGRCQLHFSRGFVVASAALTFVSPLDKSFGMMPKARRAVRWHRKGQTVVYQVPWAEGSKQTLHLEAQRSLSALAWQPCLQDDLHKTMLHGT